MTTTTNSTITAQAILHSIEANLHAEREALESGNDLGPNGTWDLPEFAEARQLTSEAGCTWDFTGWEDVADSLRQDLTMNRPVEFGGRVLKAGYTYDVRVAINTRSDIQPVITSIDNNPDVIVSQGVDVEVLRVTLRDGADTDAFEAALDADPNVFSYRITF